MNQTMATDGNKSSSLLVDNWQDLIHELYEELNEEEIKTILFWYRQDYDEELMETDEGEEHITLQTEFYKTIDGAADKLEAARKLQKVLSYHNQHSGVGENLAHKVQRFVNRLQAYEAQFVISQSSFIGREREIKLVKDLIEKDEKVVGVSICGIGGQGKTALANKVSWELAKNALPWHVASAELSDKHVTTEVIQCLLTCLHGECPARAKQEQLQNILKKQIIDLAQNVVLRLDDCDQILKHDREGFNDFIHDIHEFSLGHEYKVRFLMTMREKLTWKIVPAPSRKTENYPYVLKRKDDYDRCMFAEVELDELDSSDAIELLRSCSKPEEVEELIAREIIKECANSPLAVTVVAGLIREKRFTPDRLLFHLKMDQKNVTRGIKVDACIKQAIDNLDLSHQKALVALSVFQSSPFDLRSAHKVVASCTEDKNKLHQYLKKLCVCHLVEIQGDPQPVLDPENAMPKQRSKNTFSLHPLVFRYIAEWKKPTEVQVAYMNAIKAFVILYEEVICDVVKLLESKYWKGHRKLQRHKVHILKFYDIMDAHPDWLSKHEKRTSPNGLYRKKRMSDLADILLPIVKNRRILQNEADRANRVGNDGVYVFWMVEKADIFLMLHDNVETAIEILDQLTDGKYAALRGLHPDPFYPTLVHALFHKVKGLCRWKQNKHTEALQHLELSLKFYEQCNPPDMYKSFMARVKCYMGQVYLDMGDLNKADESLEEGYTMVKSLVQARHDDKEDELAKELHWDIPRYYNHFAVVKLRKAKVENNTEVKVHLLDTALEDLNKGIQLDERLRLNYLDGYYTKFKLRADVKIEKGLLEDALVDAVYSLDHRRAILQPPHTHYTESVYQVGRIYMLQGDVLEKKGDKEAAIRHWNCSSDYFGEMKDCHLKEGGISLTNPVLQDMKRDHLKLVGCLGQQNEQKKLAKFYQDLESGCFEAERNSSLKSVREMLWTPVEMMKKIFGGGGQKFGDQDDVIQKMENLAEIQHQRMERGEPCGGARHDSGRGHSSSDLGESFDSGSGSMSAQMKQLQLEKSVSLEDNVFEGSMEKVSEPAEGTQRHASEQRKHLSRPLKRQKTSTAEDNP